MISRAWMLSAMLCAGCLSTGPSDFANTSGDDDTIAPDGDADADSDLPEDPVVPPYPEGDMGYQIGQIVPEFSMPGGNGAPEDTWSMGDVWAMAHRVENPVSVLLIDVHSLTCGICMGNAAPELEMLWEEDGDRGLLPMMAVINDSMGGAGSVETAQAECDRLSCTHPWAADVGFANTSRFFTGGTVGTPAYIVVDTQTMEVVNQQQGWGGTQNLYSAYLRP